MSTSPRIFVTGVSGYVGGNTVLRIVEKHPEWHIAALVRNQEQGNIIQSRWPKIETVIGSLDDRDLMISEAAKADVVLRTLFSSGACGSLCLLYSRNCISRSYSRCIGTHRGHQPEANSWLLPPCCWNWNADGRFEWIW